MTTTLAERLNMALELAKTTAPYKSKAGLARHCGVRSPSVSDWFSGRSRSMGSGNIVKAAEYLGVSAHWLLNGAGDIKSATVEVIKDDEDYEARGLIGIPEYRITFACGDGHSEPVYEELTEASKAWYRPEWFQQRQINPANCRRFKVRGTSMEPLIWDRDTILVDCAPQDIIDGKVYAFCVNGQMRVKALFPKFDGSMLIRSYNPEVGDEVISPCDMDSFVLIGRVRDRSGGSCF